MFLQCCFDCLLRLVHARNFPVTSETVNSLLLGRYMDTPGTPRAQPVCTHERAAPSLEARIRAVVPGCKHWQDLHTACCLRVVGDEPEVLLGGCGRDPAEVSGASTLMGGSCGGAVTGDVWLGTKTAPPDAWHAHDARLGTSVSGRAWEADYACRRLMSNTHRTDAARGCRSDAGTGLQLVRRLLDITSRTQSLRAHLAVTVGWRGILRGSVGLIERAIRICNQGPDAN